MLYLIWYFLTDPYTHPQPLPSLSHSTNEIRKTKPGVWKWSCDSAVTIMEGISNKRVAHLADEGKGC